MTQDTGVTAPLHRPGAVPSGATGWCGDSSTRPSSGPAPTCREAQEGDSTQSEQETGAAMPGPQVTSGHRIPETQCYNVCSPTWGPPDNAHSPEHEHPAGSDTPSTAWDGPRAGTALSFLIRTAQGGELRRACSSLRATGRRSLRCPRCLELAAPASCPSPPRSW